MDLATIIYTSGTTGRPKGVMLTPRQHPQQRGGQRCHASRWTARHGCISFLPLSHIYERMLMYLYLHVGCASTSRNRWRTSATASAMCSRMSSPPCRACWRRSTTRSWPRAKRSPASSASSSSGPWTSAYAMMCMAAAGGTTCNSAIARKLDLQQMARGAGRQRACGRQRQCGAATALGPGVQRRRHSADGRLWPHGIIAGDQCERPAQRWAPLRHRGPPDRGCGGAHRGGWRDPCQRTQHHDGLLPGPGDDRARPSMPKAGCTPATSARSPPRASCASPTARRRSSRPAVASTWRRKCWRTR